MDKESYRKKKSLYDLKQGKANIEIRKSFLQMFIV